MSFKANIQMKLNVKGLLVSRGKIQKDLAVFVLRAPNDPASVKRAETWISQILTKPGRSFPMKYWERIADFFGVLTYQLLVPGMSRETDRRIGRDRRVHGDRRVHALQHAIIGHGVEKTLSVALDEEEVELIRRYRPLSVGEKEHVQEAVTKARAPRIDAARTTSPGRRRVTTDPPKNEARLNQRGGTRA